MGLSGDLRLNRADWDRSTWSANGRHDRGASASVSAELNHLDYMGFVPVITLEAGRNWSNIGLYDNDTFGLGIGFTSTF